jgi:hypothetical protein
MKEFRNFLRQPRYFLSVGILPLLVFTTRCPDFFPPPPPATCQNAEPITMDARKCVIIESSCASVPDWQAGDTFSIRFSTINYFGLVINEIRSGNSLMRRLCQSPFYTENSLNGIATYDYTYQNSSWAGTLNVTFANQQGLTVSLNSNGNSREHSVYIPVSTGLEVRLVANVPRSLQPSIIYTWRANGEIVQVPPNQNFIHHSPTRNTEYRVNIVDFKSGRQASYAVVVFVLDPQSGNPAPGDPTAAFTISGSNSQPTLNPSLSLGDIVRWEWDFDWHGEILEPFDLIINGPNGTTQANYSNLPGKKYIRLRVTTASGNFHEIFLIHVVN